MKLSKEEHIALELLKSLIETHPEDSFDMLVTGAVNMTHKMLIELKIKGGEINKNFKESLT